MTPRTALVTGAASGIGLATARRLRDSGWQVVGVDRTAGPDVAHQVDAFDTVLATNLRGAFVTVSAAWPALEARGGSVVLVSSVLGLTGGGGPFRSTAYITSEGALVALTRALAAQGSEVGVRAYSVAATIAFLCSSDAAAITGQVLAVDAGWQLDPRAEAGR